MSDSEDEVPLGTRRVAKASAPFRVARPVIADDTDSEDEVPIGQRHKVIAAKQGDKTAQPEAKPAAQSVPSEAQAGAAQKDDSKSAPAADVAKPAPTVKQEPFKPRAAAPVAPNPTVKTEGRAGDTAKGKQQQQQQQQQAGAKGRPAVKKEAALESPVKKERKTYEKPGQTREAPLENDSLRKFYVSLLEQRPESEMAKKWLVMYGLLPDDEAAAWVELTRQRRDSQRNGHTSPAVRKVKTSARPSAPKVVVRKKPAAGPRPAGKPVGKAPARKRKAVDSDDDDDDDSDDDYDNDVPLAKASKKPAAAKKPAGKARVKRPPARRRDAAFIDGGLESGSDDDLPLAVRAKTKA